MIPAFIQVQVPSDVPQNTEALLWIVVIVLAGAVGTLFWQLQKEKDKNIEQRVELVKKTTLAISEVNKALEDVTSILNELDKDLKLQAQVQAIRDSLAQKGDK